MQLSISISMINISIYNHYQQNDLQHQRSWSATVLGQDFHFHSIKSSHNSQRKERYLSCEEPAKDLRVWPQICVLLLSLPPTDWAPPARVRGNVVRGERGTGNRGTKTNTGPKHLPYRATLTGAVAPTSKKLLASRPHAGQKPLLSTRIIVLSY